MNIAQSFSRRMKSGLRRARAGLNVAALLSITVLLGCGMPNRTGENLTQTSEPVTSITVAVEPPVTAPGRPGSTVLQADTRTETIPASFFGKFAPDAASCERFYGPVTISANRLDFGWGQAQVSSVASEESAYRIVADLYQEGQIEPKPERIAYTLSKLQNGAGVLFGRGGDLKPHKRCP